MNKKNRMGLLALLVIVSLYIIQNYLNLARPEIIWKMDSKNISGGLYAEDKTIYYGTLDGYYYAIDAKSAALRWEYKLDDNNFVLRRPIISNGVIYFLSNKRKIYAYINDGGNAYSVDIKTGLAVEGKDVTGDDIKKADMALEDYVNGWRLRGGGRYKRSAVLEYGNIQFYEEEGYFYSVDKASERVIWKIKSGRVANPPIISNKTLYYLRKNPIPPGDSDWFSLHAIDWATGSTRWNWNKAIKEGPIELDSILYLMDENYLYAIR